MGKVSRFGCVLAMAAMLASCGGGGGGSSTTSAPPSAGTPTPSPSPGGSANSCSLLSRQQWAADQLNEWYLFPETLPTNLNPASYASVQAYIDALTATARAQGRDRSFTYLTSIAEENAFLSSGSSAGFGIRLIYDSANRRLFVAEAFENTPALAAGIDRGTEILAIGTSSGNLQTVASLFASGGSAAVSDALGPSTAGLSRVLRLADGAGTREVTVVKADYDLTPVSSRYGARIIDAGGGLNIGYVNLRTFIGSADSGLRNAFGQFRAAGITNLVIDLRYNGGGLVSIAELFGDLLGRDRFASQVFSFTTFRASKSSENAQRNFRTEPNAVGPTRIAFITTGGTASASELVINAMLPYLGNNVAIVGANTFGKPVGQIALDRAACDDRLRVVAFRTENANRQGDYYNGLASVVGNSCTAPDDISRPLGDAQEGSIARAIGFLRGESCTPIASQGSGPNREAVTLPREFLQPADAVPGQLEAPGRF